MFADENELKKNVYRMLDEFQVQKYDKRRLIVNLGHGMLPNMTPESVEHFIQAVRSYEEEKF